MCTLTDTYITDTCMYIYIYHIPVGKQVQKPSKITAQGLSELTMWRLGVPLSRLTPVEPVIAGNFSARGCMTDR